MGTVAGAFVQRQTRTGVQLVKRVKHIGKNVIWNIQLLLQLLSLIVFKQIEIFRNGLMCQTQHHQAMQVAGLGSV